MSNDVREGVVSDREALSLHRARGNLASRMPRERNFGNSHVVTSEQGWAGWAG